VADALPEISALVAFRNSQGETGRGTLLHLTRDLAVFEVYNPYSIVQLSEVLRDLRIARGERTVYTGRAVVSNLVVTGLMAIVSATLVDPWSDLVGLAPGEGLREEVEAFVRDWERGYTIRPDYQIAVTTTAAFLSELNRWLDHAEVAGGLGVQDQGTELEREFVQEVQPPLGPKLAGLYAAFEAAAAQVPPEEEVAHKAFARRAMHPVIMCSPFNFRVFTKPLGYAGDYEMVNMILRDPFEGQSAYAKLYNSFTLAMGPGAAHRNRITMLTERLQVETCRVAQEGRRMEALNIGCGPAAEVQQFIRQDGAAEMCRMDLMDFNQETLEYAQDQVDRAARQAQRSFSGEYLHKSIHDLLKESSRRHQAPEPKYDLVYSAGLFDYLSDRVCERILSLFCSWTRPGGLVVITNVHPANPVRYYMEHVLEWYLQYRTESDLKRLVPQGLEGVTATDSTGLNVFLDIRKR
jgi:extracellular factor (EF) 3-hydroxypalmitic acid methyl ester biosynthesis protein